MADIALNIIPDKDFLNVQDIINICGVGKSKAYDIIRDLNKELKVQGFYTIQGRVNKKYFLDRFKI